MIDPFQTLGIEPHFNLDLKALEQRHRDLSKALHPDRYAGRPATERRMALGKAIEVNEALRLLRDPIKRAESLLRLGGVELGETSEPKPPASLLMEMMDLREELSEAHAAKDLARVRAMAQAMEGRQAAATSALSDALERAAGSTEPLRGCVPLLGQLRYLRRFFDEVSAIEEDLEGP